ncbi:DUF3098 domain-containing protein [Psychroflexus salis]|uniref:DUF3098 domain-containing protein n=1 Tax=Psychroflexus salis TaxID=1526574 RepID=A0A916ZQI9_9FLAO|nr:DUF3098 domain-containing protein [Psychroflexus salis]GGE09395.1 hypothetical protein GCM10010831_08680 [Psychroflexus salis]
MSSTTKNKKNKTLKNQNNNKVQNEFIFEKKNYIFMLIGAAIISLGFILMTGGGSEDPNVFNPEIFSWRRIRLAPTLVIIGFAVEVYAILLNPHKN